MKDISEDECEGIIRTSAKDEKCVVGRGMSVAERAKPWVSGAGINKGERALEEREKESRVWTERGNQ